MKKWILFLLCVLVAGIACIYFFIPGSLPVSKITVIHCTTNGTYRYLSDETKWKKWWPGNTMQEKNLRGDGRNIFDFHSSKYFITKKLNNTIHIGIVNKHDTIESIINLIPMGKDSVVAEWSCTLYPGWNPVQRVVQYKSAVQLKSDLTDIFENLRKFIEKPENVYSIPLSVSSTTDTTLITEKHTVAAYPTTAQIYEFLSPLQSYVASQKARVTGWPMVNVTRLKENEFQVMVALPVNVKLPAKGEMSPRRMVPGRFVVTEVNGGEYTIKHAFDELQLYFDDYGKTSMAIPFQSLLTDRLKEQDTSKWVTRIYAPVY